MKIIKEAGKTKLQITHDEWEKLGEQQGWISSEAKKKKKSPKEHGYIKDCIKENKDKESPGGYCASIVDKVKGSTSWRKGPKSDKKD